MAAIRNLVIASLALSLCVGCQGESDESQGTPKSMSLGETEAATRRIYRGMERSRVEQLLGSPVASEPAERVHYYVELPKGPFPIKGRGQVRVTYTVADEVEQVHMVFTGSEQMGPKP